MVLVCCVFVVLLHATLDILTSFRGVSVCVVLVVLLHALDMLTSFRGVSVCCVCSSTACFRYTNIMSWC